MRYEHYAQMFRRVGRAWSMLAQDPPGFAKWAVRIAIRKGLDDPASELRRADYHIAANDDDYQRWIDLYDTVAPNDLAEMRRQSTSLSCRPLISIITAVYNTPERLLREAIESVRAQAYENWELCIADDCSTEPHVRQTLAEYQKTDRRIRVVYRATNGHISEASNSALELAAGDWIALLDHDDLLPPHALFCVADLIDREPVAELIYSDEDKIDVRGKRFDPYFKPDWNQALILSQNMVGHLAVFRRKLIKSVGGFRSEYNGSQDHDLVLRCSEQVAPDQIKHIPRILYHWRVVPTSTAGGVAAKDYALSAGQRAIQDALDRRGIHGTVSTNPHTYYEVDYALPKAPPNVSILIPTTCKLELVEPCLSALLEKTTYPNYEVHLLVDKTPFDVPKPREFLETIDKDPRVKVQCYGGWPFNFARINNWGVGQAENPILVLLNDDIEVITPEWLDHVVARILQPDIAAVGAMLYYPNDTIQHAGVILGSGGVADHAFRFLPRGRGGYFGRAALEQDLSCVTAGCMAIRRDVFEQVGGFDETLAVAFNDVDLCIRLKQAGWRILWTPAAELYHRESATLGQHNSQERAAEFKAENDLMLERWDGLLGNDPAYNPNLSLKGGQAFRLAFPPRHHPSVDLKTDS